MTVIELPSNTLLLRRDGDTLADVIGKLQGQCYRWEPPGGPELIWSIDLAKRILGDRPPHPLAALTPELVVHALKNNALAHEIDREYAMGTDLSVPIIATISPIEKAEGKMVLLIIDGWHRIMKAFLTNHQQPLPVQVLSEEEGDMCRIYMRE